MANVNTATGTGILHTSTAPSWTNPPYPNQISLDYETYHQLMAMQTELAAGTNINIRQVENGYIISSNGKQWLADDVEKIKELVVVIMVSNKLTDAA